MEKLFCLLEHLSEKTLDGAFKNKNFLERIIILNVATSYQTIKIFYCVVCFEVIRDVQINRFWTDENWLDKFWIDDKKFLVLSVV